MKKILLLSTFAFLASGIALAQDTALAPDPPEPQDVGKGEVIAAQAPMGGPHVFVRSQDMEPGGPMVTAMAGPGMGMGGPGHGRWWKNPDLAQKLGLSDDQISKMDKIFQDHRLKLIDLHATLEKQEVILEPMIDADHPDETQVLAQIDKVAQARAELEKANARMLLGIRNVLTPDQWKKLQAERASRRTVRFGERGFQRRMYLRQGPGTPMPSPPPAAPEKPNPEN